MNGKYIFNGTDTDKKLVEFDDTEKKYIVQHTDGSLRPVLIEVSKGIQFQVNVNPDGVFDQQLFDNINDFIQHLNSSDQAGINDSIQKLNESMLKIVNGRAELGARMNRLELIEDRLSQQEIIAKDTMAKNEGVDFEEAVMNLLTQEVIHRAALSSGAKIIQPSLIDFLR